MKEIVEALKYCENCEFGQDRNKCGKDFLGDSRCKFPDDFFKLKDGLFSELLEADKNIRIGRAVQKAFSICDELGVQQIRKIPTIEKLIEWAEQEGKK